MSKRNGTIDDATKAQIEKEKQEKFFKEKAKLLLREENIPDYEDAQDRRVAAIQEASFFTDMLISARRDQVNAAASYRVGKALDNKSTIEAAETNMANALQSESIAEPELRRLLPHCDKQLIVNVAEWRGILLLPKEYRDLIGIAILDDEESIVETVAELMRKNVEA